MNVEFGVYPFGPRPKPRTIEVAVSSALWITSPATLV